MRLQLHDGDRIGIVGGGPAGSFAALHLLEAARAKDLSLHVTIFEPRDFQRPGPAGCNRCAGVLSHRLLAGLATLDISLPEEVIQAQIKRYAVHFGDDKVEVKQPDPQRRIISVYRGGGPRLQVGEPPASFDAFLLSQACQRGAHHKQERVREVSYEQRPIIHTREGDYQVEFLVLATGVNSKSPLAPTFAYQPPRTRVMVQNEIMMPEQTSDNQIEAFFDDIPGLLFGATIPKGHYLTLSLLGNDLRLEDIDTFSTQHNFHLNQQEQNRLCACTPRIAVSMARGFWGDRWVAVGDAAVTRLYKDGIGSAFYTAQQAMITAVQHGISARDFAQYYMPMCRTIHHNNRYGRYLFRIWQITLRVPAIRASWAQAIRAEAALPPPQKVHNRILWGMLTGDESYRDLFWLAFSFNSAFPLLRNIISQTIPL